MYTNLIAHQVAHSAYTLQRQPKFRLNAGTDMMDVVDEYNITADVVLQRLARSWHQLRCLQRRAYLAKNMMLQVRLTQVHDLRQEL